MQNILVFRFVASGASGLEVRVSARLLHHLSVSIRSMETSSFMSMETLSSPASFLPPLNIPMTIPMSPTMSPIVSPSTMSPTPMSPSIISPSTMSPGSQLKSAANLSDYLSPGKLEALRYSLGAQSPPSDARSRSEYLSIDTKHKHVTQNVESFDENVNILMNL